MKSKKYESWEFPEIDDWDDEGSARNSDRQFIGIGFGCRPTFFFGCRPRFFFGGFGCRPRFLGCHPIFFTCFPSPCFPI